jgi:uncharacterized Rossmann fold enzyme
MIFETDESSPFFRLEKLSFTQQIWIENWYPLICEFLNIDSKEDLNALEEILQTNPSKISEEDLLKIIKNKAVYAIAPGVYLEEEFSRYLDNYAQSSDILISADGATSYVISKGIIPNLIVTDLDGTIQDQLGAQIKGSIPIVHIHGDNLTTVSQNIDQLSKKEFLITTQTTPLPGSFNFCGFTDGDRIVCLSTLMSASKIGLIGFDFGSEIGKYSKSSQLNEDAIKRKQKKFTIAKSVINWCSNAGQEIFLVKE